MQRPIEDVLFACVGDACGFEDEDRAISGVIRRRQTLCIIGEPLTRLVRDSVTERNAQARQGSTFSEGYLELQSGSSTSVCFPFQTQWRFAFLHIPDWQKHHLYFRVRDNETSTVLISPFRPLAKSQRVDSGWYPSRNPSGGQTYPRVVTILF